MQNRHVLWVRRWDRKGAGSLLHPLRQRPHVAASVIVGDGITLVYNVLNGELTARFVLKALVVAAIAGTAFGYYTWSTRADDAALGR